MPQGITPLSHPNWLLLQWIAYNKDSMLLRKGQFFYGYRVYGRLRPGD
jgi:hypothetical protein